MEKFNIVNYWNSRYLNGGNSGKGSYAEEANYKAKLINQFIKQFEIATIQEHGCGDGNNLSLYEGFMHYNGYDVSKTAVEICKKKFPNTSRYWFTNDITEVNVDADMVLSLDVLYHLVNDDDYYDYLHQIFNDKHKYVVIYATNHENNIGNSQHVRHRNFISDLQSMICFSNYRLHSVYNGYVSGEGKVMVLFEMR
jgi:hypothetical protein